MEGALLALHAGLDAVLHLQDGIIRRDQAMAAGLTEPTVDSRVRRGRWIRVLPRVYTVDVDPARPTSRSGRPRCGPGTTPSSPGMLRPGGGI
jgi:hypothetical protein